METGRYQHQTSICSVGDDVAPDADSCRLPGTMVHVVHEAHYDRWAMHLQLVGSMAQATCLVETRNGGGGKNLLTEHVGE